MNLIFYGSGILLAIICLLLNKRIITLLSSIIGGLLVSYNIGFLMNLLENFYEMLEKIKSGQPMGTTFYVFVGISGVLSIGGMVFQLKQIKNEEFSLDEDEHFKRMN
jgi:hypothetical protein